MSIAGIRVNPETLLNSYDLDELKDNCKPLIKDMNEDMKSFREKHKNYWVNLKDGSEGTILVVTAGAYLVLCTDGEIRGINQEQREEGRVK